MAGNLVAQSSLWLGQPPPPELQVLTSCYRLTRVSPAQLEMSSFYSGKSATALRDKTPKVWQPNPFPLTDRPDRLSKMVNCVS